MKSDMSYFETVVNDAIENCNDKLATTGVCFISDFYSDICSKLLLKGEEK